MIVTKDETVDSNVKIKLKRIMPAGLLSFLQVKKRSINLLRIKMFDMNNYRKAIRNHGFEKCVYNLFMYTHILEKGLSHKDIRYNFGESVLSSLSSYLNEFNKNNYDKNELAYKNAISALKEYVNLHEKDRIDISFLREIFTEKVLEDVYDCSDLFGGSKYINLETKKKVNSFSKLACNRYSIREFSDTSVDIFEIEEAIKIAQKSPSACNRQSVRVHIITDKKMILKLLEIQNGLRGYQLPNVLLVTTVDQIAYSAENDRNMGYIDGGLFTMSLLYALEERLIGACLLNTNFPKKVDREIKCFLKMNRSDIFINFIPVGNLPTKIKVCNSQRVPLDKIIIRHS